MNGTRSFPEWFRDFAATRRGRALLYVLAGFAIIAAIRLFIGGSIPAAQGSRRPVLETLVMNGRGLAR